MVTYATRGKHKVFISFYHQDDEYYRVLFQQSFRDVFINKSVQPGAINTEVSTDYIKRLIREGYLDDASVVVVLVGPNTKSRKHVDWEISAGINPMVGGRAGLVGLLLPTFPLVNNRYDYADLPPRLADNVKSGFAKIYTWNDAVSSVQRITQIIDQAFEARVSLSNKCDNSRNQKVYNG